MYRYTYLYCWLNERLCSWVDIYINSHITHMYSIHSCIYIYICNINVKSIHFIDIYMYTYTYTSTHIRIHIHLHIHCGPSACCRILSIWTPMATPLFTFVLVWAQLRHANHFVSLAKFPKLQFLFSTLVHTRSHVTTYKMKTHASFLTFWCMQLGPMRKWSLHAQKHATCPRTILRWSNSRQPKCWELIGPIGLCNLVGCRFGEDSCWDPIKRFPKKPSWYCLVTMNWLFGETVINTAYLLWHFALFL